MARKGRTYEWSGSQLDEVSASQERQQRPIKKRPTATRKESLSFQGALALFTFSSVLLVFSGLGLLAFCLAAFAIIFG